MWELDHKESWELSPLDCKEIKPVNPKGNQSWRKDWCWSWNFNTLATWCKELTHWKRPWCWERLKAGEGDDRGCNGWIASSTRWTWVWASSGSWWWTGKPDMLQSMGSQRVRHDWVTELTELYILAPPLPLGSNPLEPPIWETASWAWRSQKDCQITQFSTFTCAFFFSVDQERQERARRKGSSLCHVVNPIPFSCLNLLLWALPSALMW